MKKKRYTKPQIEIVFVDMERIMDVHISSGSVTGSDEDEYIPVKPGEPEEGDDWPQPPLP